MILATALEVDIITLVLIGLPVLSVAIGWIVRLEVKVRLMEKNHVECRVRREAQETAIHTELSKIGTLLTELKKDVEWMVRSQKNGNGGKRVANQG